MPSLQNLSNPLGYLRGGSQTSKDTGKESTSTTDTMGGSTGAPRKPSTVSYTRKRSIIAKIKDYQTERRSERFYRFLHKDLTLMVYYASALCSIFHVFYCIVRETEPKSGNNTQKFVDAVLRFCFSVWLCWSMIKKPAQLWHAPFQFWMALHLFSAETGSSFGTISILFGVVILFCSIALTAREARFYLESPKLYKAFSGNATMVDERGYILFYRRTKAALVDAGASSELTNAEFNLLIDGNEFFEKSVEDPSTITEELYLNWDQFALLYESYTKMVESGKFAHGATKPTATYKDGSAKAVLEGGVEDLESGYNNYAPTAIGANASMPTKPGTGAGEETGSVPDESVLMGQDFAKRDTTGLVQIELEEVAIHEEPDAEGK